MLPYYDVETSHMPWPLQQCYFHLVVGIQTILNKTMQRYTDCWDLRNVLSHFLYLTNYKTMSTPCQRNLKMHHMFFVHVMPKEFENATIAGQLYLRKTHHFFWKDPVSKCFPSTLRHNAKVFKLLQFVEHFQKTTFLWWISVDGRV